MQLKVAPRRPVQATYDSAMSAFLSYARNGEDVVLWRALGSVAAGRYVEVAANHPGEHSTTRAFDDRGWNGVTVEPSKPLGDVLAESGGPEREIHFLLIDAKGAEKDVLQSGDFRLRRPWVLVVESTGPNASVTSHQDWEPELLTRGYEFCLFDGLARFYVAAEKADLLRVDLSYPACLRDDYQTPSDIASVQELRDLLKQTAHWRTIALTHWADAVSKGVVHPSKAGQNAEAEHARNELVAMRRTLSWRVTRPLRGVRRVVDRARRGR
jgi:hypothetical protein